MKDFTRRILSVGPALLIALAASCWSGVLRAGDEGLWQPGKTRVFIVSVAQFQSGRLHSFTPSDRLDDRLAELFKERGVPAGQILLLKDQQATTQNIKSEFTSFLQKSHPGEMLVFHFSSHGGYDPKTDTYKFYTYNGALPFNWAFDAIEHDFKGTHAILLTDCCYSGGIVDLAMKRKTPIAYACLSSTYDHQIAWSGWRFIQCLNRGLAGDPVVDLDGNGHVALDELAAYTARYMAFAAEGKPLFKTTGGFDPKLRLAATANPKSPRVGELLEVKSGYRWAKAEILDARAQQFKIHFTADTKTTQDGWIGQQYVRPFQFQQFPVGVAVDVQDADDDTWHSAKVLEHYESLHLCRYDGRSSAANEWFGPSRIRASLTGSWSGRFENDLGEGGPESLVLRRDEGENLSGTWSGDVQLNGERIGKDVFFFEATTPHRLYRGAGRITGGGLQLDYHAHRKQGQQGSYYGWATLLRKGDVASTSRGPRAEFSGKWTGTYENSRSGSGPETLELAETAGGLKGVWSDVAVTGERLGNASFYLAGKSGQRTYRVVGRITQGELRLDYSAMGEDEPYFGWSTLKR
jgi:hypothetical protein